MLFNFQSLRTVACCLLAGLFLYVTTYVLMMDWRRQAFDPVTHRYVDQCAYRCAPVIEFRLKSPQFPNIYIVAPCVCWANRAFWPIDLCVRHEVDTSLVFEDGGPQGKAAK